MSDFLGTKLTNHDVNEVRREFRKKRKHSHYDEYDFYVYYKNLLSEERKKKEKRERNKRRKEKEQAEAEDEFKPSNYISSRYKRNEDVTKKGIYDYIDEEDSIYEDIITSGYFDDKENYADDLQFTFFNESVSYALLRNNNYIDGIPIGINIQVANKYMREDVSKGDTANTIDKKDYVTSMGAGTYVTSSPRDEKKTRHIETNCIEEPINDDVLQGDSSKRRKPIGPKLPTIFEQIRHKVGEQTQHSTERNENEYINILSSRNRLIAIKMEEQKGFEKLIKDIYKPKNNFEGAFYKKKENSIDQVKKRELDRLRKDFLLPHQRGIHDEGSIEARTQIDITTGRKQMFGQTEYEDYSDSSLEDAYTRSSRRNANKDYAMVLDKKSRQREDSYTIPYNSFSLDVDSGDESTFVLYSTGKHHAEEMLLRRSKFYRTLFGSRHVEKPDSRAIEEEIEDLNMRYAKLMNPKMETKLSKSELLELYVPKKSWVQTGSSLTHEEKEAQNEIYVLKNKINFNNDLKKRYRFYFYCRMKEGKINADGSLRKCVENILSPAERAEFEELRGKLKVYYLDFYNREIANEDVNTNFQIQEYEFAQCLCEKLGILDPAAGDQSGEGMEKRSIVDDFLKIPQFVFDAIFCA
ncbi:hypothetical protein AK88_04063 [Plasmodium fragile]|uniref:Uncharacterized protein n=1 Tax=Plasmodium fragile TaxID=5857 RepID=A0A0D9QH51_PLAFR|nr:uncharacterized protein AK88_04063 [Plasmodium fragile]KJP86344.1 hypothetical protein AK88_04063 [Plasmodium fragile]